MLGMEFTEAEKRDAEEMFVRLCTEIGDRERMLLLLDNVDQPQLLSPHLVTRIPGDRAHLLVTTRLAPGEIPGENKSCLALDELPPSDCLRLLEKHRPFADEQARAAAEQIVAILGGFALAAEAIGVFLRSESTVDYSGVLERLKGEGLAGVEGIAANDSLALSRHREKLLSATLAPSLRKLSPIENTALQFAALLLPDGVPVPWLKELVSREHPEAACAARPGYPDPWLALVRRLDGMRFLVPASNPNLRRMHRLVQSHISGLDRRKGERVRRIDPVAASRAQRLESAWWKIDVSWEIEPLKAWACRGIRSPRPRGKDSASGSQMILRGIYLRDAIAFWDANRSYSNADIAQVCASMGRVEENLCHIDEALWLFNLAVKLWERSIAQGDLRLAQSYVDLAAFERRCGNGWSPAYFNASDRERAIELLNLTTGGDSEILLQCITKLALLLWESGRRREALKMIERGIAVVEDWEQIPRENVPAAIRWFLYLSVMSLQLQGCEDQAQSTIGEAIRLGEIIEDPYWTALGYRWMGILEKKVGHLGEARKLLLRAIEMQERLLDPTHLELGESYAALAEVEEALGNTEEARVRWVDAAKIGAGIWFPWGQLDKWPSWSLKAAKWEQSSNHLDEARKIVKNIVTAFGGYDALKDPKAKKDPRVLRALFFLADLEIQGGKPEEAKGYLRRAQKVAISYYGETHAETKAIDQKLLDLEK